MVLSEGRHPGDQGRPPGHVVRSGPWRRWAWTEVEGRRLLFDGEVALQEHDGPPRGRRSAGRPVTRCAWTRRCRGPGTRTHFGLVRVCWAGENECPSVASRLSMFFKPVPPCPPPSGRFCSAVEQQLAGQAGLSGSPSGGRRQALGQGDRVEGRDRAEHRRVGRQLTLDRLELGDVVLGEEVVDGGARRHGEHGGDGVPAEQFPVVLVLDLGLVVGVQVAGVGGPELQLGDAEAQQQGDGQADDGHRPGTLAQVEPEPRPGVPHRTGPPAVVRPERRPAASSPLSIMPPWVGSCVPRRPDRAGTVGIDGSTPPGPVPDAR